MRLSIGHHHIRIRIRLRLKKVDWYTSFLKKKKCAQFLVLQAQKTVRKLLNSPIFCHYHFFSIEFQVRERRKYHSTSAKFASSFKYDKGILHDACSIPRYVLNESLRQLYKLQISK